jgi:hypothetical protein
MRRGQPNRYRLSGLERLEPRAVMAVVVPTFTVTKDWGSGFQGQLQLANRDTVNVADWTLTFDYGARITSIWDAKVISHVGTRYTVGNAGWNSTLAAGGSVSFGFVAAPGTSPTAPVNYLINGQSITTPAPTPTPNPSPSPSPTPTPTPTPSPSPTPTPSSGASAAFRVTSDWGSGFNGDVTLTNKGTTAVTGWRASFDFSGQISSLWNGSIESHVGTKYVVKGATWNTDLPAGATTSFGFTASPGGAVAVLRNLVVTGTTLAPPAPLPAPAATAWGDHAFAPYADVTLVPMVDLAATAAKAGTKHFTLAFITADPGGQPAWGGYQTYRVGAGGEFETQLTANLGRLRTAGGDAAVSFGGAAGRELAQVITSTTALTAAYRKVVDAYLLRRIDFDIEGAASADKASIDRRWQAVAQLQKDLAAAGKSIELWATLPVLPTGLTSDGLYVVQSAVRYGVNLSGVNVMAMDYGDSAAPSPAGRMGAYAIQAATATFNQLKGVYGTARTDQQLWRMVGVTPMIGVNDVTTEVFTTQDAQQLLDFARSKQIGLLAMWSINRDQQSPRGATGQADAVSSGILQSPLAFSSLLAGFEK